MFVLGDVGDAVFSCETLFCFLLLQSCAARWLPVRELPVPPAPVKEEVSLWSSQLKLNLLRAD